MMNNAKKPRELALLKKCFESQIITRGRSLHARNCVQKAESAHFEDEVVVEAVVNGDSGYAYEVQVEISDDDIDSYCTCPFTFQCKHGAAVALWYYSQSNKKAQTDDSALNRWLCELKEIPPRDASSHAGAPGEWAHFYLLSTYNYTYELRVIERYRKQNGEWGRKRDIQSWNLTARQAFNHHDQSCINLLRSTRPSFTHGDSSFELRGELGHLILQHALQSGRIIQAKNNQPLTLGPGRELKVLWQEEDNYRRCTMSIDGYNSGFDVLPVDPLMYYKDNSIGPLESSLTSDEYQVLAKMPRVKASALPAVSMGLLERFGSDLVPLPAEISTAHIDTPQAKATLHGVNYGANGTLPALKLSVCYGQFEYPLDERMLQKEDLAGNSSIASFETQENTSFTITRSVQKELAFIHSVRRELGFMPSKRDKTDDEFWVPSELNPIRHIMVWQKSRTKLEQIFERDNWIVEIDNSYPMAEGVTEVSAEFQDEEDGWFSMHLDIDINGATLNTANIVAQWLSHKAPDELPIQNNNGEWVVVDMRPFKPIHSTLLEMYSDKSSSSNKKLPPFKAAELANIEDINTKSAPKLNALRKKLRNFKGLKDVTPPSHIKAELREYQQKGLNWLMFLHDYRFGGVLADDMGLGKTLQALAFLQKLKSTRKLKRGALVVAPTSLMWNWKNEAKKFTPSLRTAVLHGSERNQLYEELGNIDVAFTTYALAHRDLTLLEKQHFDVVILDEAQYVKNKDAKTAKAVRNIPADMRVCLTGTPLENHLGELWSIMDFALPGLLGHSDFFKQAFRNPIEQDNNPERRDELARRVAPFMLRRRKEDVATELPEKTFIDQMVELSGDQKKLYESIRISMEKRVRELIRIKGVSKSHIEFLDALLKLRQACIAPQLVKLDQAAKVKNSAKLEWLRDTVPELIEDGRRILIFSQFTQMLTLIGDQLNSQGLGFCKLTGKTRRRQEMVRDFQEGKHPIFLISLKAGGSGLNLTRADTVIHVDPWWNPAAENQATDRAHRIGQKKSVFVYKLIAQGTVEEKIQRMQEAKQSLADSLFDETRKAKLPKSGDELLELFKN